LFFGFSFWPGLVSLMLAGRRKTKAKTKAVSSHRTPKGRRERRQRRRFFPLDQLLGVLLGAGDLRT
jgi:hypothetical protein